MGDAVTGGVPIRVFVHGSAALIPCLDKELGQAERAKLRGSVHEIVDYGDAGAAEGVHRGQFGGG
jgi:hypothetical protein